MDKRYRFDHEPPGAHGPLIWFLIRGEPMEIRMTRNSIDDCFNAALSLNARFFIMRRPQGVGLPDGWAVFDTQNTNPDNDHTPLAMMDGGKVRPLRIFDTETLDAPVMWAITKGGM